MTRPLDLARRRALARLAGLAGLLLAAAMLSAMLQGRQDVEARQGEPVLPGFSARFETIDRVEFTLPDDRYTLEKGEDGVWGLKESGGYPVRRDMVAALFDGLADMTFETARTQDAKKFDRLGLGDPEDGGNGARILVFAGGPEPVAELLAGRRGERTYVRPGEGRAWRVNGDLPPLHSRAAWLDLSAARMPAAEIEAVSLSDAQGVSYSLIRTGRDDFEPGDSGAGDSGVGWRLASRYAAAGPGLALSRFAPVDVARLGTLDLRFAGSHASVLRDGLEVRLTLFTDAQGRGWAAVEAAGSGPRVALLSAATQGWAYRLTAQDFADLTAPREAVLVPPAQ